MLVRHELPRPDEGAVIGLRYCQPTASVPEQTVRSVPAIAAAVPPPPDPGAVLYGLRTSALPAAVHQFAPPPRPRPVSAEPAVPDPGRAWVSAWSGSGGWAASILAGFRVYGSPAAGLPIDYAGPIAVLPTTTLAFTVPTGLSEGTWMFGVRAFNQSGEEQNADCAVTIAIDALGNDISNQPGAPYGLVATPTAGAGLRVSWWYPQSVGPAAPAGFSVYCTAGGSVSYATAAATVSYASGFKGYFVANLAGLTDGQAYAIGVRAFNSFGAETNTNSVAATATGSGPMPVDNLLGTAVV